MRPTLARRVSLLTVLVAVAGASAGRAGDPIPDIDITLEQIPGGVIRVDSLTGGFDEISIEMGKELTEGLEPVRLPPGWTLEAEGKTVRLAGPALSTGEPVRLELHAQPVPRPKKISYEVKLEGRRLLRQRNVAVEPVPPRKVIGSLQGIVTMPTQVAPGEPMQMRVTDPAALPAGGSWHLTGTVVAEEKPQEAEEAERRRVALVVAPEDEAAVPAEALRDVAAALATLGVPAGSWEVVPVAHDDPFLDQEGLEVAAVGRTTDARQHQTISNVSRARHETAKVVIQNIKAIAAPAGGGGDGGLYGVRWLNGEGAGEPPVLVLAGLDLPGSGGERGIPMQTNKDECKSSQDSKKCCEEAGGAWWKEFCFEKIETDRCHLEPMEVPADTTCIIKAFDVAERPGGGKIHTFDITGSLPDADEPAMAIVNTTRSHLKVRKAVAAADGTVVFDLPDDVAPGGGISLQYVDAFGDVVVDVPEVPGVEVVEPVGDGGARVTAATPLSFAGQQACVCGSFPGPEAWNRLLLDGEALGSPLSASSRMAWVQLPVSLAPGEHLVTGAAEAGFPAGDRAAIRVVQVAGELDSTKLQRQESTPLRLRVQGTTEPVTLRLRNNTPSIVRIDGGDDQAITTSGGDPNQLERTVHGLTPGAFDIQYELQAESCPCAPEGATYYW